MEVSSSHRSVPESEVDAAKERIDDLIGHVDSQFASVVNAVDENAKDLDSDLSVYHYTNDNGLEGILSSKTLRLSDLFTLNDPSELLFGLELFTKRILTRALPKGGLFSDLIRRLDDLKSPENLRKTSNFFVLSTSWHDNDLGQWRSYADNGHGFALEFDRALLDKACLIDIPKMHSFPISYDTNTLKEGIEKIADDAVSLIESVVSNQDLLVAAEYAVDKLMMFATLHAIACSLFFKHDAYANEREVRFLEINNDVNIAIETKRRPYEIAAFRSFGWYQGGINPLKSIVVGPSGGEKSFQFAKDCLRLRAPDLLGVAVRSSDIPYRG